MKLHRYTPLFHQNGEFRCRVNRHEVAELLANHEADLKCDQCGSTTGEGSCVGSVGHDLVLIHRPVGFARGGPPSSITYKEIEAYSGAHGYVPRVSVRAKFREAFLPGGEQR